MTSFETFNQFDKRFKNGGNFGNECNACPLFALYTVKTFLDNGSTSKETHEYNLTTAVNNYGNLGNCLPKYMAYDELLQLTDIYKDITIQGTTPELINSGILSYEHMFKPENYENNYGVIFLKNGNYIVVLVENIENGKMYHIRDCHEQLQYDYDNFDALMVHLNEIYQFNEMTIAGGMLIFEFSNIEFVIFDKPFNITLFDQKLSNSNVSVDELIAQQLLLEEYK